jgi:hypothetical protein
MTKDERLEAIKALEEVRGSRVLAYVTADRGVANAPISEDVLRIAYDHVRGLVDGQGPKKLDLFIYSRGGDMMLPWPLVNMFREFFDDFSALVPFKAHSAATFIALGADEIVMTPVGELTPVEPTVKMAFSPSDPSNPANKLGINVEDVAAYFEFTRDRAEVDSEAGKAAALGDVTRQVHPIALGHVHRFHKLASLQSEKLLSLHMDTEKDHAQIEDIKKSLVSRLFAHEYRIGRREARALGLNAVDATADEDAAIWQLFEGYEAAMDLRVPVLPTHSMFPPNDSRAELDGVKLVYVESGVRTDVFAADFEFTRTPAQTPPGQPQRWGPQVQMTILRQAWATE